MADLHCGVIPCPRGHWTERVLNALDTQQSSEGGVAAARPVVIVATRVHYYRDTESELVRAMLSRYQALDCIYPTYRILLNARERLTAYGMVEATHHDDPESLAGSPTFTAHSSTSCTGRSSLRGWCPRDGAVVLVFDPSESMFETSVAPVLLGHRVPAVIIAYYTTGSDQCLSYWLQSLLYNEPEKFVVVHAVREV